MKMKFIVFLIFFLVPALVFAQENAYDFILNLAKEGDVASTDEILDTGLAYDGTVDNNLRFIGKNPNNFIWFNNELWRIIGIMNNVEDSDGNKSSYLKIIRYEGFSDYSLDVKQDYDDSEVINNWGNADLMKLFNPGYEDLEIGGSLYWNSEVGKCYSGSKTIDCDFSETGLKDFSHDMIVSVKWYLGAGHAQWGNSRPSGLYKSERGDDNTWIGKVGLIYPSDYGFSTSGGETKDRAFCVDYLTFFWQYSEGVDCRNNTYLLQNRFQFSINPSSSGFTNMYILGDWVTTFGSDADRTLLTFPTLYLSRDVVITDGNGTIDNPYIFALPKEYSTLVDINSSDNFLSDILGEEGEVLGVVWKVEDSNILKIEDGKIIPLSAGKTDISTVINGKYYKLSVEVTEPEEDIIEEPKEPEPEILPDNPDTGEGVYFIIFLGVLLIFIVFCGSKYKKNLF